VHTQKDDFGLIVPPLKWSFRIHQKQSECFSLVELFYPTIFCNTTILLHQATVEVTLLLLTFKAGQVALVKPVAYLRGLVIRDDRILDITARIVHEGSHLISATTAVLSRT
jgi:hypothetical protein